MSSPGTLRFGQVNSTPSAPPVGYDLIYVKTDDVLYVQDSTGTEVPLGSSSSITALTGDVTASGPGSAVATVNFVGGQSASAIASTVVTVDAASSINTPSTLVERDSSGNFSAGIITASLMGNATTATTAVTSTNFTGSLMGDVTGTQSATVVSFVGGYSAAAIAASVLATQDATSTNTASTIVERDASGNFASSIITASLMGNVTGNVSGTASNITGLLAIANGGTNSSAALVNNRIMVSSSGAIVEAAAITASRALVSNANGIPVASVTTTTELSYVSGVTSAIQTQLNAISGSAITSLTGDVSATGPGAATATVNSVGGSSAANIHSAELLANAATALNTASAIVRRDGTGSFAAQNITLTGTISASNFSGSSSGTNTGDVTTANTNSIDLAFSSGQLGLNATLNLSAAGPDAGYIPAFSQIESDGLLVEVLAGNPVNVGTTNNIGSAASASRSDHVHAISNSVILPMLLTGYVTGSNTPITATSSILGAFENLQAQISASVGSAITSLTGDGTATGPGAAVFTLATVNSNTGSFGSSTSIPTFTVNAKGLITAASGNAVVAPAGTLTGSTLASNVLTSSLTAVGTITVGVWNGTALTAPYMLPLADNEIYVGNVSNQPAAVAMSGDVNIVASGATTIQTNVVSNSKLAQAPTLTLKGNNTGGTANVTDLTVAQVNTMLGDVTTVGTYNGGTANANAATITGNTIYFQSASVTFPGMVDITTQSFAGNKTFTGQTAIANTSTSALAINTNSFIFDTTNNALGIGIQPSTSVMIDGVNISGASKLIQMTGYGIGSTTGYRGRFARGTIGSPAAVQSGDILNALSGRGYGASQFAAASTGVMNVVAGETFTNTSNMTYLQFSTTPTGSVTSAEAMRVATTGVTLGPQSASTALHQVNGGIQRTIRTVTASTLTVDTTTTDDIIFTDSTSNAITITLPTATNGRVLVIQDKTGQAATNHITVTPPGSVTINGVNASVILGVNYGGWIFMSDGTNWTYYRIPQLPTVSAISASNIDWSTVGIAGGLFTKTLSANTTFTFSNATPGQTIVIRLTNTDSNYTVTWPTIKWPVQTTPVMTTGAFSDVYTIIYDGTNYFGSYVQNF